MRLSKSNFYMGNSPKQYVSTNVSEHPEKSGQHYDKNFRLSNANKNHATNFIHNSGFEKLAVSKDLGPMTHKGNLNQDEANQMMNKLKAHNFILGKDQNGFTNRSSASVGRFANSAR